MIRTMVLLAALTLTVKCALSQNGLTWPRKIVFNETQIIVSDTSRSVVLNLALNMMLPKLKEALGDYSTLYVIRESDLTATYGQLHNYRKWIKGAQEAIDSLKAANTTLQKDNKVLEEGIAGMKVAYNSAEQQYQNQIEVTDKQKGINRKNKFFWGCGGFTIGGIFTAILVAVL